MAHVSEIRNGEIVEARIDDGWVLSEIVFTVHFREYMTYEVQPIVMSGGKYNPIGTTARVGYIR